MIPTTHLKKILPIAVLLCSTCLQAENLIPNGDFETGQPDNLFVSEGVIVSVFQGSPTPGEGTDESGFCAELILSPTVMQGVGTNVRILVDPTLKYRISVRVFTEASVTIRAIGNAFEENGAVIISGEQPWTYWLKTEDGKQQEMGPTPGWITMQTTLGPAGSGADYEWEPNTAFINLNVQFGEAEGKAYIDDRQLIQVEEF